MTVIKATAHLNELTKDVKNDYYLLPFVAGTLYDDDIIRRLEVKEIATRNVNGKAFVQLFHNECILALSEGYNVVTGLFQASVGIKGVVYSQDLGHNIPTDRLNVSIRLTQGAAAREAIRNAAVQVAEQAAPVGPVIQNVTNPTVNLPNTLNTGAMALVQGVRLAVKGDREDETGVFFTPAEGGDAIRIPATQLSPNTPAKLQFALPADVTAGEWTVAVATQATGTAGTLTKEVRRYEYPDTVTVE
ncbi:hypothetical protein FACS189430_07020 [Bacteroidia bacterium]|nr:hypothetical protein FACS189430_07020 [Bacteroidia bacterium]